MAEVLWNEDKEINGLYCPYQKKLFELYDHTIFLKKLRLFFFFFLVRIYIALGNSAGKEAVKGLSDVY